MKKSPKQATTPEEVWRIIGELGQAQQRTEKAQKKTEESFQRLQKAQEKTDESFQRLQESRKEEHKKTEESFRRLEKAQEKTDESFRRLQESRKEEQKKTDESFQRLQESRKEEHKKTEESFRRLQEAQQKTEKNLNKAHGDFTRKWGLFMENLVSGNLIGLFNEWHIPIKHLQQRVPVYREDGSKECEYDLVAINGDSAVVFEVKTTLAPEHVNQFLKKLKKFKENFPKLAHKRIIYGGLAFLGQQDESVTKFAEKKGLFLVQAPGGKAKVSVLVNGKNFKPKKF